MKRSFPSVPLEISTRLRAAFSLVEILAVMAILAVLAAFLGPALSSLSSGTGPALDEVGGMVERARHEAMQSGRWVWLGLADTSRFNGEPQVAAVTVASRDGSPRMDADNLVQIDRAVHVRRVRLSTSQSDDAETLGTQPCEFPFKWSVPTDQGRKDVDFSTFVVGFSPRGEAVTGTSRVPGWIRIALSSPGNSRDVLSLLVSGSSGQIIANR